MQSGWSFCHIIFCWLQLVKGEFSDTRYLLCLTAALRGLCDACTVEWRDWTMPVLLCRTPARANWLRRSPPSWEPAT